MSIRDHLAQAEVPTSAKVNHAGSMELSENHVPGQPHVLNTSSLSWGSSHRSAHIIQWGQPIPEDVAQGKSLSSVLEVVQYTYQEPFEVSFHPSLYKL